MRDLLIVLPRDRRPSYLRLAQALRVAIQGGRVGPGQSIPSTRVLAGRFGLHRHTVMAALDELVAEGWLEAVRGHCYRVTRELPEVLPTRLPRAGAGLGLPSAKPRPGERLHPWRLARPLPGAEEAPIPETRPASSVSRRLIEFRSGLADLRLLPLDELRSHMNAALRSDPRALLGFGGAGGHPRFVKAWSSYLRRVRALPDRPLLITHGSQEALFLVAQLLLRPGDSVAVEALGYPPAWDALRWSGARLRPVAVDDQGLDPEAFERLCRRTRVRLLYVTPLHQYPTTVTLAAPRRTALMRIASRHGVPILEDDYDHEYHYRCEPLAPLAADDPEGLVLCATTLTKVLHPSARVGALVVPHALHPALVRLKSIASRQVDNVIQETVARWLEEGGMERHLRRTRRHYAARLDVLADAVATLGKGLMEFDLGVPDGGMAAWLRIDGDSHAVERAAETQGVRVRAGHRYRLDGRADDHLRLGFACLEPDEIREGIQRLARVCRET